MSNSFPAWHDLLELWLEQRHAGKPAVVLVEPLMVDLDEDITPRVELMKRLVGEDLSRCVHPKYVVVECESVDEASKIMRSIPENQPYTLVWDGRSLVSHH